MTPRESYGAPLPPILLTIIFKVTGDTVRKDVLSMDPAQPPLEQQEFVCRLFNVLV